MNQTESMILQNLPYPQQFKSIEQQNLGVKTYEQLVLAKSSPANSDNSLITLKDNVITIPQNAYSAVCIKASLIFTTPVDTATQLFLRMYEHANGDTDQSKATQIALTGITAHGGQTMLNYETLASVSASTSGYSFAVYAEKDNCSLYAGRSIIMITPFAHL